MRRISIVAPLVLLVAAHTGGSSATAPAGLQPRLTATAIDLSPADIAAIRATSDRWMAAVRAGRWVEAADTFTDDATLWFAGTPYVGKAAIRRFHETMPPFDPTRVLHIDEIRGRGDMAYVAGHSTIVPAGDRTPVVVGRYLDIRLRQPDGSWLFYRDMVAPAAPPAPTQAVEPELYTYDVEARIAELGIALTPTPMPPGVKIVRAVTVGDMVYLSGNGPLATATSRAYTGKVGIDLSVADGHAAARATGVALLTELKREIGDLNKVVRIVKALGMVNAGPAFTEHPQVINGFSELMIEVFGDRGQHARSAIGVASLPWNLACEVEMIVQVRK